MLPMSDEEIDELVRDEFDAELDYQYYTGRKKRLVAQLSSIPWDLWDDSLCAELESIIEKAV
jgi:hypothetical protein